MSFSTQYSLVAATALRRKPTAMRPFSIWPLPAHLAPSAARRLRLFSFPQSTVLALSRLQPSPTATLCFPVSPDLSGATQFERDFSTRESCLMSSRPRALPMFLLTVTSLSVPECLFIFAASLPGFPIIQHTAGAQ